MDWSKDGTAEILKKFNLTLLKIADSERLQQITFQNLIDCTYIVIAYHLRHIVKEKNLKNAHNVHST